MKKILLALIVGIIVLLFIPFETTLVPEWKLRVINENGNPYKGKIIREMCYNYTLGISPCSEANDSMQRTDENGYVIFPERKIDASLFFRVTRSIFNFVMLIAHGSYGVDIYVDSSGPQGYKTLEYKSNEPLPEKFILPSESFKKKN